MAVWYGRQKQLWPLRQPQFQSFLMFCSSEPSPHRPPYLLLTFYRQIQMQVVSLFQFFFIGMNTNRVFGSSSLLLACWLFFFYSFFLLKRHEGLKVWSFGLLINLLLTVCPLVTCVLEKDEAAIESSEFNATSVADVDKRVKRRLLMGNSFLPLSICCYGACACTPDFPPLCSSLCSSLST